MRSLVSRFLRIGETTYTDPADKRASYILNQFLILAIICVFASLVVNLAIDRSMAPFVYGPVTLLFFGLSLFLNYKGHLGTSIVILFIFVNTLLFLFTVEFGVSGMAFLYFFPVMLGQMFLLADEKFSKIFLLIFGLTLLTGITSILLALNEFSFGIELIASIKDTSPYLNTPLSFIMLSYLVHIFLRYQKRKEKNMQLMINEKQTLLSEVHHRVKNNLAIISSLLNLQKNSSEDVAIQRALDDSRNRIYTMALIHEKLYKNQTFSSIGFSDYAESLLNEYVRSSLKTKISTSVSIDGIRLVLGQAIPCGLILNELITNSVKHGLRDRKEGEIALKMWKSNGKILLDFKDDGHGVEDIIRMKEQETLGMTIIQALTEQLNGKIIFSNDSGLRVHLEFPEEFERDLLS